MVKYYEITGADNGFEIEPFVVVVSDNPNDVTLESVMNFDGFGDGYRDAREITRSEYDRLLQLNFINDQLDLLKTCNREWMTREDILGVVGYVENLLRSIFNSK